METKTQRKTRLAAGNWAALDTDTLCSIFIRLPYVDLLRVKSICWGWHDAVVLFRSFSGSSFLEMPWLIYTPPEDDEITEGEKTGRFVNMEENKIYPFNDLATKKMNDGCCYCVGSSHDWLTCLDKQAIAYLLNPFSTHRIDLPRMDLSIGVEKVQRMGDDYCVKLVDQGWIHVVNLVRKAVLSSSPSLDRNYHIVIIYGFSLQLAFCKDGDTSWTKLNSNSRELYDDIIFHENQLYGICKEYSWRGRFYRIRVWDMNEDGLLLVKTIDNIMLEELITMPPSTGLKSSLSATYLVESQGSLLLVTRFDMDPCLFDSDVPVLDLTSITSRFRVFKLDLDQQLLTGLTSLSGFSLFLGRNRSISVDVRHCEMLKQDAIYFNSSYGRFPSVFSLKDNSFVWLYGYKRGRRESVPTWIVPLMKPFN